MERGNDVILVRAETSPEDIGGMHVANGIVTARGGMTSHAAVVARGMGTPCVSGVVSMIVDYDQKVFMKKGINLILPHKSMTQRNFVLLPLFEINQSWKHPKSKINIAKLISSLKIKDLRSIKQI